MAIATTTIALASVALAAVGTGVGVYSAVQAGEQAEQQSDFNQKIANYNAAIARNRALMSEQQAGFEAAQIRRRNVLLASKQRAAFAKSGVELSGSAEDIMYDSAVQGELEAMIALYTGRVNASRAISESDAALMTGEYAKIQGDNAKSASILTAGGTALSGAGQIAQNYGRYKYLTARSDSGDVDPWF